MVAPGFLQNPEVRRWLNGVEPAWTMLEFNSLNALRHEPSASNHAIRLQPADAVYDPKLSAADNRRLVNQRRPLGNYYESLALGEDVGTSSYNALVVSFEKRMTHGLMFSARYTYSKSLDDASTIGAESRHRQGRLPRRRRRRG